MYMFIRGGDKMNVQEIFSQKNHSIENTFLNKYIEVFRFMTPTNTAEYKFTERNLTVNFATAIKKAFSSAVCWYEFPYKIMPNNQTNQHIDAVMIVPKEKIVFVCEAKRNFPQKDIKTLKDDIRRIIDFPSVIHREHLMNTIHNPDSYTYIGVLLLDAWKAKGRLSASNLALWEKCDLGIEKLRVPISIEDNYYERSLYFDEFDSEIKNEIIAKKYTIKIIAWELER